MSEKMIIIGKECSNCQNATLYTKNRARAKVSCSARNKEYYWGTCIPCDEFTKIDVGEENEENCEHRTSCD